MRPKPRVIASFSDKPKINTLQSVTAAILNVGANMNEMTDKVLLVAAMGTGLISCQSKDSLENKNQIISNQIVEQIKSLPDSIMTSMDMKTNVFQMDLSEIEIDAEKTSLLNGEWTTKSGNIRFLNTTLKSGDKVIFRDTTRATMTGWGTIRYNRAANFYFTESGSFMYEFYVADNNKLVLTQYDYRNDDLTMKKSPESIVQELDIEFINENEVRLSVQGQTVELNKMIF